MTGLIHEGSASLPTSSQNEVVTYINLYTFHILFYFFDLQFLLHSH